MRNGPNPSLSPAMATNQVSFSSRLEVGPRQLCAAPMRDFKAIGFIQTREMEQHV